MVIRKPTGTEHVNTANRSLMVAPALVGLLAAGVVSVKLGIGGEATYAANRAFDESRLSGLPLAPQRLQSMRDQLASAVRWSPRDPSIHELLFVSAGSSLGTEQKLEDADRAISEALRLRPASAVTWANFAAQRYLRGDTGVTFETAIERAVELGPYESEVQRIVANYGLAVFDEVRPSTKSAIEKAVVAGMVWDVRPMMQIAQRRGRLDVACRLVSTSPRPDRKWSQLCESMEAKS